MLTEGFTFTFVLERFLELSIEFQVIEVLRVSLDLTRRLGEIGLGH